MATISLELNLLWLARVDYCQIVITVAQPDSDKTRFYWTDKCEFMLLMTLVSKLAIICCIKLVKNRQVWRSLWFAVIFFKRIIMIYNAPSVNLSICISVCLFVGRIKSTKQQVAISKTAPVNFLAFHCAWLNRCLLTGNVFLMAHSSFEDLHQNTK